MTASRSSYCLQRLPHQALQCIAGSVHASISTGLCRYVMHLDRIVVFVFTRSHRL